MCNLKSDCLNAQDRCESENQTCKGCFKSKLEATERQAVLSNSTDGLCCPWDSLENEEDGHYKNFAAWGRWMNEKSEAILDDMDITHETDLYGIMIDIIKAT